jgi:hypothetical protein
VRVVRQQAVHDREGLAWILDPDVHVHAPDHHLATPPLGAVDERRVALLARGDLLLEPLAERVRARAQQVDAERVGDPANALDHPLEIGDGVMHPVVRGADDLDGVGEQLAGHLREGVRGVVQPGQHLGCGGREFAARVVDAGELPLEADGRALRRGEFDLHMTDSGLDCATCAPIGVTGAA